MAAHQVCISQDDLEALYALYPECHQALSTPVCFKTKHNIGWVRLGVYFLVPCIAALVLATLAAACAQKQQQTRLKSARNLLRAKSSAIGRAMFRLSQVWGGTRRSPTTSPDLDAIRTPPPPPVETSRVALALLAGAGRGHLIPSDSF